MGDREEKQRFFSIELESKAQLRNVTLKNEGHEGALIEGTIGALRSATFVEGVLFEISGNKGVLRINLSNEEISKSSKCPKEAHN